MASNRNDEHWIRSELVPSLESDGKLGPRVTVRNVEVARLSMEESFMLTSCYRIKVDLGSSDTDDTNTTSVQLVVKITPDIAPALYRVFNFPYLFQNEVVAYERIFPTLGWSESFPKYFYSHIRDTDAAIVLGDFNVDGWRLCKARVNLSLEHIMVSVKELGKFHGTMFGLKHTDKAAFEDILNQLQESRFRAEITSEQWDRRLRIGIKRSAKAVRDNAESRDLVPEAFLRRIESVLENPFLYQQKRVVHEEPLAVLCHGDFLRNNIAYKYINGSDIPEAAMMFDFQTLRYSSPMMDLTTFIANSTGVDDRSSNFENIFGTYYHSMSVHYCKATGIEAKHLPEFLSYTNFLREYAKYLPYALSVAASFLPVLHVPDGREFSEYEAIPVEEDIRDGYERGGETVDRELRSLVREIYELQTQFGIALEI